MIRDEYIKEYKNKVINESLEDAIEYKNSFLLNKKIYKFIYLNDIVKCESIKDINDCIYLKGNKSKIDSIRNKKIWVSSYAGFNDPFELSRIYINESKLTDKHYKKEVLQTAFDRIRDGLKISCFTDDHLYNLPMWAHYTNNHKGLCLEFKIENPSYLYPVTYLNTKKLSANTTIHNFISLMYKLDLGTLTEEENEELLKISNLIINIFSTKEKLWEYEREYRIFYPDEKNIQGGFLVDMKELGLKLTGIYLGNKIEKIYEDELKIISKDIDVNIYKMYVDELDEEFKLTYKDLL
ncbi:DUF2971 domain-containing protein [Paraclostridium bifermentans]|uniref:DUF2971 domain-containing protein n=1 Tax=Paraclostridium bifermentans TaxID=1490 RepID=UPI0018AB3DFC|nr:DUF2971 domain-containing protein [Paraclostridium bifermentans]